MKKILLIASALMAFGTSVNAQVSENPVSTFTTGENVAAESEKAKSYSGGMYVKYQFNNVHYKGNSEPFRNLAVGIHSIDDLKWCEVGLELAYFSHGDKQEVAGYKVETTKTMWKLSLILKMGYRFSVAKNCELFPYATFGPAWNITGSMKTKMDGDENSISIFDKDDMGEDTQFHHFTYPVGIGMKAYFDSFQIGVEYTWDFLLQSAYTHSGLGVSIGFLF